MWLENLGLRRVTLPLVRFWKLFVYDICSSIHPSCASFIKIGRLLRVASMWLENLGLRGVILPLVRFWKLCMIFALQSTHSVRVARKYRSTRGNPSSSPGLSKVWPESTLRVAQFGQLAEILFISFWFEYLCVFVIIYLLGRLFSVVPIQKIFANF